jgi:hypothetical protein
MGVRFLDEQPQPSKIRFLDEAAAEPQPHYADVPYTSTSAVPLTRERKLSELSPREMVMGAIETPVALAATIAGAPLSILTSRATPEVKAAVRPFQYEPRSELAQRAVSALGEATSGLPPYIPSVGGAPAAAREAGVARAARQGRTAERLSEEAYARGPQIEAAQEANRLGIALNPALSNPTLSNQLQAQMAGIPQLNAKLSAQNVTKWSDIARRELGIDPREQLNSKTFEAARERIAAPYREVKKIGQLMPDEAVSRQISSIRAPDVIGGKAATSEVASLVDDALERVNSGMTSADALLNIRQLRNEAQDIYRGDKLTPAERATADAKIGIANALEKLIDMNVTDPALLDRFRDARTKLAKSYTYEKATNLATGRVDPIVIAKMIAKDDAMTGDIAAIGRIAANFPEIAGGGTQATLLQRALPRLTRSGVPGTIGLAVGSALGTDLITAGAIGAGAGELAGRYMGRRIASPEFQARSAVPPDLRIPMPPPPAPAPAPPTPNLPAPYDWRNAVQTPDEYYVPNFVFGRPTPDVRVQPPTNALLPAPSAESTMAAVAQRRAFDLDMERALAQQAEQAAAAQAAAARRPAGEGMPLELDPTTGRLRPASQGLKGATPETFVDYGTNLDAAVRKIESNARATLTAEEKIAWDRRKVDLQQLDPSLKKLSDAALVDRSMDRTWAADAVRKAREKAAAFDQIAQRSRDRQAVLEAQANRERMLELADQLEDQLRAPRPVRSGSQGKKTMEFKRNQLAPKPENKLIEGE